MRIISIKKLRLFWLKHNDAEISLRDWYHSVKKAEWISMSEIKNEFSSASIINKRRVCFNIKGNTYRLITEINFDYGIVYIRFIGTHSGYDKINAKEI